MRKIFALVLSLSAGGSLAFGQSPYESSADFAKYAMKLRGAGVAKSGTSSFYSHIIPTCDGAVPVENEHRDNGVLDWRGGGRK